MDRKILLFLMITTTLLVVGCTRSADANNKAVIEVKSDNAVATATIEVKGLNVIEVAGTRTAMASGSVSAEATSVATSAATTATANPASLFPTPTPLGSLDAGLTQPAATATVNTLGAATAVNATQAPAATSLPAVNPGTYTIHEGEFPYCLARRFDVDPGELMSLNGISATQSYFPPGTEIKIPTTGAQFPSDRSLDIHPTSYTVGYGESLYTIACKFGDVDPNAIANANGIAVDAELTAGTVIQIP